MEIIGKHLSTEQFNSAINKEQTTIIDMRNIYESEVGKFKNAEIPQVEKSKDLSGIGLSIVKKIVDIYKGEVWLESEIDKGTIFYFTLKK